MTSETHAGKTAVITGATSGLGFECATSLAKRGWRVVLACRDAARGEAARARMARRAGEGRVEVMELDTSSLESVRAFLRGFAGHGPVDALICNAGMQATGGPTCTAEGFETTFATNHLGHFVLARGLLEDMSPGGAIVFVSSGTHDPTQHTGMPAPNLDDIEEVARGRAFHDEPAGAAARRRYTTSKLCNVLCAYELDRRMRAAAASRALRILAFNPGLMPGTGLARDYGPLARFAWTYVLPALTPIVPNVNSVCTSAARLASLVADESPVGAGAAYISRGRVAPSSRLSYDEPLALRLWEASARFAGLPNELTLKEATRSTATPLSRPCSRDE